MYDGEAIKNIDYDLDVKVYPDGSYQILDENEYAQHAKQMQYPAIIMKKVEDEMQKLLQEIQAGNAPFNITCINNYIHRYFHMISVDAEKEATAPNMNKNDDK